MNNIKEIKKNRGETEEYNYEYYLTDSKIYITLKPKYKKLETYATNYPRGRYAGKPNGVQKINFIMDAIYQYETGGGIRGER